MENELYHYGVLGMKWGVRRYQPYPKGKHGTFLGQSRDEDIRIEKGTKAFRVNATDKLTGSGQTYVSLDMLDHLDYLAVTASNDIPGVALDATVNNKNDGRAYSLRLKLKEDIIMPSYQATMDSFIKTVDDYGGAKKLANDLWNTENRFAKQQAKEFVKGIKKMDVDELRDRSYKNFSITLFRDSKARTMFFDDLKSKGYNAIIDESDKQFGEGMTQTPVIVFDKSSTLSTIKSKPLTDADYSYMRDLYFTGPDLSYIREKNPKADKEWDKYVDEQYKRLNHSIWRVRENQNGSDELYHYGILGMKWGVRRTPEQLGHKPKTGTKNVGAKPLKYSSLELQKAKNTAISVAVRTASMFDPTGILATAYNTAAIASMSKDAYNSLQTNEKYMSKDGSVEKIKDLKKKTVTGQSMEEDSKSVNSGSKGGRTRNCMCCVTALEMRQRGYDVQARRRAYGYVSSAYKDWFEGVEINSSKVTREKNESRKDFVNRGYNQLTKNLEKYPNNSRGFIAFNYEGVNSGHTISWQVKNGEVTFYDAQGKKTAADKVLSFSDQDYEYGRLDNCKLKPAVTETVVSRKRDK